jgi:hypothetical protein
VTEKKDHYAHACLETFFSLGRLLKNLFDESGKEVSDFFSLEDTFLSFQSRFGREKWLTPSTEQLAIDLVKQGYKHLFVCAPSFTVDCLETWQELGEELQETIGEGGMIHLVPCLNDDPLWIQDFSKDLLQMVYSPFSGSPTLGLSDRSYPDVWRNPEMWVEQKRGQSLWKKLSMVKGENACCHNKKREP